jgi:hypothetical protein
MIRNLGSCNSKSVATDPVFFSLRLPPMNLHAGLNRTGKSCRLRWVNYLHPGLKRGRMTPHEERLVLELHARWGNRFDPKLKHA